MLADDGESIVGLLLVVEAPSREAAQAFATDSPFGKAEIFADLHGPAVGLENRTPRIGFRSGRILRPTPPLRHRCFDGCRPGPTGSPVGALARTASVRGRCESCGNPHPGA